jgi:chloride channel 3/4/5
MIVTTSTKLGGIAYESWPSDVNGFQQNNTSNHVQGSNWHDTQMAMNRTKFGGASAWLCLIVIGVVAGSVASVVDIATGWMKDLREGICQGAFYLNREQCCWSSNDTMFEGSHCSKWTTWPQLLGITPNHSFIDYFMSFLTYILSSLLFAGLAALLVKRFAPHARGSGIPEVKTILSGFVIKGYLSKWTFIVKSISMVLAVAAGLSLGKEGPFVHIVCCIGNIVSHFFPRYARNDAKKREILSASSAAGVSVAFGAPIGGVLFSLEEVSYYFPLKTLWRSFFCALVAAFVLRSINPFSNEHMVMFYVDYTRPWILFELVPFALLGALGGIIGSMFIKFNLRWCYVRKTSILSQYPVMEVLAIALITSFIGYHNEFTRMNSSELIKLLFTPCGVADVSMLCDYQRNLTEKVSSNRIFIAEAGPGVYKSLFFLTLALIFKFVITIFTFGLAIPTGLFIPAMTMGAITGRIIGVAMEQIAFNYPDLWIFQNACSTGENCMTPGLYAMVGAAAALSGVTRMTVSLVVIMFELTGNADFIVPVMVAVMFSKWVGDAFGRQSIYDAHIYLNDYPCLDPEEKFNAAQSNSTSTMQLERVAEET